MMYDLLDRAVADRRVHRRHLEVYRVLLRELDPLDFRPVKREFLAHKCDMRVEKVSRALTALISLGYLARGELTGSPGREVMSYRLTNPRSAPVPATAPVPPP